MKKIFFVASICFFLLSCNIYRTISFNADHSGSMETKIDMTSMIAMMNENGGTETNSMGSMSDMAYLDKSKAQLEGIIGISNVKVSYDTTGIMYSSYDFSSTESLVNAMNSGGSANSLMLGTEGLKGSGVKPSVVYKGKKFFFEEIDKKTLKKMQSEESKKEMAQMDMILASSTMNTTINFPTTIKKVSYKNASIINDQSVNYVMPVKDFISKDYKPLVVNLK